MKTVASVKWRETLKEASYSQATQQLEDEDEEDEVVMMTVVGNSLHVTCLFVIHA